MRRAYRELLNDWLKGKRRGPPLHKLLLKGISAHIHPALHGPIATPILATVEVTRQCNLGCVHCRTTGGGKVDRADAWLSSLIRAIADADFMGIGFTGGEPLLLDSFEERVRQAVNAGLIAHVNTNGTLVTPERARRLLDTGLTSINLSLDGGCAATHDPLRGKGSFDRALEGARALADARDGLDSDARLLLVTRLCDDNADDWRALLPLAKDIGFEGCSFLPMHERPGCGPQKIARRAAEAAVDLALRKQGGDSMIDNSVRYLKGMARFFVGAPMPLRCSALHSSLYFSSDRGLYPCVPSAMRSRGHVPFAPERLLDTFRSNDLSRCLDRGLCESCWWNCHRELDIALGVL